MAVPHLPQSLLSLLTAADQVCGCRHWEDTEAAHSLSWPAAQLRRLHSWERHSQVLLETLHSLLTEGIQRNLTESDCFTPWFLWSIQGLSLLVLRLLIFFAQVKVESLISDQANWQSFLGSMQVPRFGQCFRHLITQHLESIRSDSNLILEVFVQSLIFECSQS